MVTTTVTDIIVAAYAKSTKNKPKTIATEATELVQLVLRQQRKYYAIAPRINYTVFAGFVDVTAQAESGGPDQEGWAGPEEESVFLIQRTKKTEGGGGKAGEEVVIVSYDDPTAEEGKPAVFHLGSTYFPAGNALDPTGGELRFFFSRRPTDPVAVTDTLDVQWKEQFNELLILDVAIYLANKDGRTDEAASLSADRKEWMLLFAMHLEHRDAKELRRFANDRRFNGTTLLSLTSFGLPAQ